jgi:O-antigen/teichoic acid export membrane protein
MNLGERIRSGVAWLMFGNTGSQALQFLFGIALARLLVPADFGMIATIQILTGIVSLVSSAGMGQSLVRAKNVEPREFNIVFTVQLALGVAICGGIFAVAPWFARFFENALYEDLLKISALNFLLRPFALIRTAWLNREMKFAAAAAANLATTVVSSIAAVVMAAVGLGVWSLSLGGFVAALTTNLVLYGLTPLRLKLCLDAVIVRRHSAFGLRMTVLDLLAHVKNESITFLLSKLAGPTFLGLFNKAESLARMPNRMITPPTGQVVFRALSSVSNDLDQSKYIFYRTITLLSVYAFPFLAGFIWVAEPLIQFLYGEKWLPAAEPARIMAVAGFVLTSLRPCAVLLEAQNRLGQEILVVSVSTVVAVVGCYVGLNWGLAGVAWAVVLAHLVMFVLMYGFVYQAIPTRLSDLGRAVAPALILNGLLVIVLGGLHYIVADLRTSAPFFYLAAMGTGGGAAYTAAFLFLPIPGLETEAARWRARTSQVLARLGPGAK